jgi:hypothetical protein
MSGKIILILGGDGGAAFPIARRLLGEIDAP